MGFLEIGNCLDSAEMAISRKQDLDISSSLAKSLGVSAVAISRMGEYTADSGKVIDIRSAVHKACAGKISIPPDFALPESAFEPCESTHVLVSNETTLQAAFRLARQGLRPLALNFANGISPGGGFLHGARAQEETLCRSSALYCTLEGDPLYTAHRKRSSEDSTDWAIYSPSVPVFRLDAGAFLDVPWHLCFVTCAAPVAQRIGTEKSAMLMKKRIHRVLEIAHAYQHTTLVLGAWGCGAFGNDPYPIARCFRESLETEFAGKFSYVSFAISDWSPERRILKPFARVFCAPNA